MTPTDLARHAEQQASDAAWTRCAAEELRLRRLLAERARSAASTDPREELQGDLSYRERRLSERLRAEVARLNAQAARDLELRARFDSESA